MEKIKEMILNLDIEHYETYHDMRIEILIMLREFQNNELNTPELTSCVDIKFMQIRHKIANMLYGIEE